MWYSMSMELPAVIERISDLLDDGGLETILPSLPRRSTDIPWPPSPGVSVMPPLRS
jgi:hypothetical protein